MTLVGANREPRVEGTEELPGKANYFIGKDPTKWRTNVPAYKKVQYHNIYPGIDLVYYGNQRQLEYDFVVHPGADPNRILLSFQGVDKLEVDALGDLVVDTGTLTIRQRKPVIYQDVNGVRQEVAGGYVLKGAQRVGFQAAAYDQSLPLVIDPTLFYSTYLGGSGDADVGLAIAVDTALNAYVAGFTASTDFPTTAGAFQTTRAGDRDVFVAKLNPTGSSLLYSTYLGGSGSDEINVSGPGIALDGTGGAYVTGFTSSRDFPTTLGAFQPAFGGGVFDAFVTKLNPTGSGLVYSTYLGGSDYDLGSGIAVGVLGNAYVTGSTNSADFPTTAGAFQATPGAGFVTNIDPTGSTLVYSTYLVGAVGAGIAVDGAGHAYVTGFAGPNFLTTAGAFQPAFGGVGDAFVTKLDPTGSTLVYSTYLGGSGGDGSFGIAVDGTGNAYITGSTGSTDFPTTPGAFQPTLAGVDDAFVTKLDPTGSTLVYSTYLGGSGVDEGRGIAVDGTGNAYVAGRTDSEDFPTTTGTGPPGNGDAFVTKLNPTGSGLVYSTYLGGNLGDAGVGIAVDVFEDAYVTGITGSTDFPTTPGAFQPTLAGAGDAFVAKITEAEAPPGPFSARVTGGGTIDVMDGIGTFSFIIQRQADTGELSGRLQYVNHASGAQVQSVTYTSLVIVGSTATFGGDCTVNGMPCTFTVNVADNGEPGTNDTFTISASGGPTEGGTLQGGNILITQ
jgi:hypothetical protein